MKIALAIDIMIVGLLFALSEPNNHNASNIIPNFFGIIAFFIGGIFVGLHLYRRLK